MWRLSRPSSVLACAALPFMAAACESDGAGEQPYAVGIGAEFMAQQAPAAFDRSMFVDPRGPRLSAGEVFETAGKYPFYWTRAIYSGYGRRGWGGGSWAVDFPKSDRQFLIVLKRLVRLNAYEILRQYGEEDLASHDLSRYHLLNLTNLFELWEIGNPTPHLDRAVEYFRGLEDARLVQRVVAALAGVREANPEGNSSALRYIGRAIERLQQSL